MDSKSVIAVLALGGLAALALGGGGGKPSSQAFPRPSRREPDEPPYPTGLRRPKDQENDLGWQLFLDPTSPVFAFVYSTEKLPHTAGPVPRPCSHMTAAWVSAMRGKVPAKKSDWVRWEAWRNLDPDLFDRINLYDARKPWDNIPAVKSVLGGASRLFRKLGIDIGAPELTTGRWHLVQSWTRSGGEVDPKVDKGHSFLVYGHGDGDFSIIDSDIKTGYEHLRQDHWHRKGRDAYVLTLPDTRYATS